MRIEVSYCTPSQVCPRRWWFFKVWKYTRNFLNFRTPTVGMRLLGLEVIIEGKERTL